MSEIIKIDGSAGGGSVLRIAIPVAVALGKTIEVYNIRNERSKPGLRVQHLAGLNLIADIAQYQLKGGTIGSKMVRLSPLPNRKDIIHAVNNKAKIELTTAASVSLIIQSALNYCAVSARSIYLEFNGGGTHTRWAPTFDYLENVTFPIFAQFGIRCNLVLQKIGFYPLGGAKGSIDIKFLGKQFVELSRSELVDIDIYSVASNNLANAKVVERQIVGFLSSGLQIRNSFENYYESRSMGTSITGVLNFENGLKIGSSVLGKKSIKAEDIGERCGKLLKNEMNHLAALDQFMCDQLVVPLAFSKKGSNYSARMITDHLKTNLNVINQILDDQIEIEKKENIFILNKN